MMVQAVSELHFEHACHVDYKGMNKLPQINKDLSISLIRI